MLKPNVLVKGVLSLREISLKCSAGAPTYGNVCNSLITSTIKLMSNSYLQTSIDEPNACLRFFTVYLVVLQKVLTVMQKSYYGNEEYIIIM